ncbi:MAG: hypothetical protein Q9188_007106 [Gyalolechia gomerana]
MAPTEYPQGLLRVGGLWALLFAIPLCISLGWYILSHWGWWKLHHRGARFPLVRTWHGWVDSGKGREKRERNRLRKPPPHALPRTTRADYSWVFWDPTGDKQQKFRQQREETMIRYLPRWMRSSPFGSVTPTVDSTRDIEAARVSEAVESDGTSTTGYLATLSMLGRGWYQGWRKARTTWSDTSRTYKDSSGHCSHSSDHCSGQHSTPASTADKHTLDDTQTTVRMRKSSQRRSTWEADSEDVERATNNQLLAPTAGSKLAYLFRRSSTPESNTPSVSPSSIERGVTRFTTSRQHHQNIYPRPHSRFTGARSITMGNASLPFRSNKMEDRRQGLRENFGQEHNRHPARRVRTWAYGVENVHLYGIENIRPRSVAASILDAECDNSHLAPAIVLPKRRKEDRNTDDSTAEAERMSIIDVPGMRYAGVGGCALGEGLGLDEGD